MSGSSEAMSEHPLLVHLELSDNEAYLLGYKYVLDDPSGFERESSADFPSKEEGEASPSGHGHRKIILPRI